MKITPITGIRREKRNRMDQIIQAIGSVGFPIVACLYMAYLHNETQQKHSDEKADMIEVLTKMSVMLDQINDTLNRLKKDE